MFLDYLLAIVFVAAGVSTTGGKFPVAYAAPEILAVEQIRLPSRQFLRVRILNPYRRFRFVRFDFEAHCIDGAGSEFDLMFRVSVPDNPVPDPTFPGTLVWIDAVLDPGAEVELTVPLPDVPPRTDCVSARVVNGKIGADEGPT